MLRMPDEAAMKKASKRHADDGWVAVKSADEVAGRHGAARTHEREDRALSVAQALHSHAFHGICFAANTATFRHTSPAMSSRTMRWPSTGATFASSKRITEAPLPGWVPAYTQAP